MGFYITPGDENASLNHYSDDVQTDFTLCAAVQGKYVNQILIF